MNKKGTIKVNPYNFTPVVSFPNGHILWAGTIKEKPEMTSYTIQKNQQKKAFDHLNKTVKFESFYDKFGDTYAKIIFK